MIQTTVIDTRHLSDLWRLDAVQSAYKDEEGRTFVVFSTDRRKVRLTDGDVITHDTDTGEWDVILTMESARFNGRLPRTTGVTTG